MDNVPELSQASTAFALKHSHSVPVKNRREAMNPLLFRNSRSNIYVGGEIETDQGEQEQRQCENTINIVSTATGDKSSITSKKRNSFRSNTHLNLNLNSQTWTIDQNKIDEISPFFQIQRTHTTIEIDDDDMDNDKCKTSPSTIAKNISTYLNTISVSTLYDNENGIAHAELEGDLRILVRLFRKTKEVEGANNDTNTNNDKNNGSGSGRKSTILVEVSRRDGCSAQFHSMAMNILHAAEGKDMDVDALENAVNLKSELKIETSGKSSSSRAREAKVSSELRNEFLKQVKIV